MPSPTPVGSLPTAVNSTAGTSCAPAIPTGLTNGQHWMLLVVSINGNKTASINTPTGWTPITGSPFLNSASTETLAVYRKLFATGDGAPSVTWTTNSKNDGFIIAYKDADLTTPFDVTPVSATGSSTTPTSPSVAAVTRGATRIHIHGTVINGTGTPSVDCVERVDISSTSSSPAACYLMDQPGMAEGATGTRAATTSSGSWVAVTIWLRPAVPTTFGLLQSASFVDGASNTTYSKAFPNALTSGSCLVSQAACFHGSGQTLNAPTYPGGTFVKVPSAEELSTNLDVATFTFQNNTDTTAATVTQTVSATADCAFLLTEWLGPATTGTLVDTQGIATATSTAVSATSGSTSAGTRLALLGFSVNGTETSYTMAATYTQRWASVSATFASFGSETREFTGGSTETATATLVSTSSEWAASLVILLPASAATVALAGRAGGGGSGAGLTLRPLAGSSPGSPRSQALTQKTLTGRAPAAGKGQTLFPMVGRSPGGGRSQATPQRALIGAAPAVGRNAGTARPAVIGRSPGTATGRSLPGQSLAGRSPAAGRATGQRGPVLRGIAAGQARAAALAAPVVSGRAGAAGGGAGIARPTATGRSAGGARAAALGKPTVTGRAPGQARAGISASKALAGSAPGHGGGSGSLTAGALVALVGRSSGAALARGLARLTPTARAPGGATGRSTPGRPLTGHSAGQAGSTGTLTATALVALVGRAMGGALARATSGRGLRGSGAGRSTATVTPAPTPLRGSTGINSSHGTLTVGTPLIATAPTRGGGHATAGGGLRGRITGWARVAGALILDTTGHRRGHATATVTARGAAQSTLRAAAGARGSVAAVGVASPTTHAGGAATGTITARGGATAHEE